MPLPPNMQFADKLPMDPNCHKTIALRNAIRSYEDNVTGEDLRAQFVEDFPPEILFSLPLLNTPTIHRLVRDFLAARGIPMPQIGRGRTIQTLVSNLYTDNLSDKDIALSIRDHFISPFSNRPSNVVPLGVEAATAAPSVTSSENDSLKKAQNIAVRFRDDEKKFSGKLGENYSEYIGEFTRAFCRIRFDYFAKARANASCTL
jgi:hypothetical protein